MTPTLAAYAAAAFPEHTISGGGDFPLDEDAVVAHFRSIEPALAACDRLRSRYPDVRVEFVEIITDPGSGHAGGDGESPAEVPRSRVAATSLVMGVLVGGAALALGLVVTDATAAVVAAGVATMFGMVIGFLVAGGGRFGGERAWSTTTTRALGSRTVLVAVQAGHDRVDAAAVVGELDAHSPVSVRIVNRSGWRTPST